jgi:hypothetical protein
MEKWFNDAKGYHRDNTMRIVKVTREELFSRPPRFTTEDDHET